MTSNGSTLPAVQSSGKSSSQEPKSTKMDVMRLAHSKLQVNQYGLPPHLFRPDILPNSIEECSDAYWDASMLLISYAEGYPTINYGAPLWDQLDFEPVDAFLNFQHYRDQINLQEAGIRSLSQLADSDECLLSLHELYELFFIFYWPQRARAYDLFEATVKEKLREHRALTIEDTHFTLATKIGKIAADYILDEEGDGEFMDLMNPKTAIELLKFSTQTQRISSGLPAAGPRQGDQVTSLEISMQTAARQSEAVNDDPTTMRDAILQDPVALELAQKLVIKMKIGGQNVSQE